MSDMDKDGLVQCTVTIPQEIQLGVFANAFRVLQDTGQDFFLDFLVFSGIEKKAVLVSRIRVNMAFLPAVRERLSTTLTEIGGNQIPLTIVPHLDQN